MHQPLISIIIPCYNQAHFMDECLESVFFQSYQNWECIMVNDQSLDNTEEVALKWTQKDKRFKYIKKQNGGLSSTRNAGIKVAQGVWILPLDSDDYISHNYLELAANEFKKDYTVIYCRAQKFGIKNEEFNLGAYSYKELLKKNQIFCSAFFRKITWEKVGGYDENMKNGFEDWDFWLSALYKEKKAYKIPEICFFYRKKESSMVRDMGMETKEMVKEYIFRKHQNEYIEYFGTYRKLLDFSISTDKEKQLYKTVLNSKRYRWIDSVLSFSLFKNK